MESQDLALARCNNMLVTWHKNEDNNFLLRDHIQSSPYNSVPACVLIG